MFVWDPTELCGDSVVDIPVSSRVGNVVRKYTRGVRCMDMSRSNYGIPHYLQGAFLRVAVSLHAYGRRSLGLGSSVAPVSESSWKTSACFPAPGSYVALGCWLEHDFGTYRRERCLGHSIPDLLLRLHSTCVLDSVDVELSSAPLLSLSCSLQALHFSNGEPTAR